KTPGPQGPCGFKSHPRHQPSKAPVSHQLEFFQRRGPQYRVLLTFQLTVSRTKLIASGLIQELKGFLEGGVRFVGVDKDVPLAGTDVMPIQKGALPEAVSDGVLNLNESVKVFD